jgi:thiamine biosynthesis lipoprotein
MNHLMQQIQFRALGGLCQIDLISQSGDCPIVQLVKNEVDRIEKKYSRFIPNSVVGMINHNAGSEWVECDEETLGLIQYAFHLYEISNGLFDITSGVLRSVWNFQEAKIPSSDSIKKILPLIGLNYLERNGSKVKLAKKGMQIDLGGIGKEYAVDKVTAILQSNGIESALINFAGDLRAINTSKQVHLWHIGIQNPRCTQESVASIPVKHGALTTSGDYERYFELNQKRYCHILNPKTAYPVRYWRSVTVLAPLTIAAGATSTIAMLLEKNGLEFLRNSGFAYLAIDHKGQIYKSDINSGIN